MRLSGRAAMGGDAPNPALGSKKGPPRVQHRGSARSLLTTTTTTRTHPVTIMHLLSSAAYGSISLSWSPPQRPQMRMPCSDAVALALRWTGLGWTWTRASLKPTFHSFRRAFIGLPRGQTVRGIIFFALFFPFFYLPRCQSHPASRGWHDARAEPSST
jgi:hypothetical protein